MRKIFLLLLLIPSLVFAQSGGGGGGSSAKITTEAMHPLRHRANRILPADLDLDTYDLTVNDVTASGTVSGVIIIQSGVPVGSGTGNVTAEGFALDQILYGSSATGIKGSSSLTWNDTIKLLNVNGTINATTVNLLGTIKIGNNWTMPIDNGTNTQVFKSNGDGTVSWAADATGGTGGFATYIQENGVARLDSSAANITLNFKSAGFNVTNDGNITFTETDPTVDTSAEIQTIIGAGVYLAPSGTGAALTAFPYNNITGKPIVFPISLQRAGVLIGNNSIINLINGTQILWTATNTTSGLNITPTIAADAITKTEIVDTWINSLNAFTPAEADEFVAYDDTAGTSAKITYANFRLALQSYFDNITTATAKYLGIGATGGGLTAINGSNITANTIAEAALNINNTVTNNYVIKWNVTGSNKMEWAADADTGGAPDEHTFSLKNQTKSVSIYNLTVSHDPMLWKQPKAATLTGIDIICVGGTNATVMFEVCDASANNCLGVNVTGWIAAAGTALSLSSFTIPAIGAGNYTKLNTTGVNGAVTNLMATMKLNEN